MCGPEGIALWDEEDGFYYDALHMPDGSQHFLKVRSFVGLVPLFAVQTLEPDMLGQARRLQPAHAMVPQLCSGRGRPYRYARSDSAGGHALSALVGQPRPADAACCAICWTKMNFFRLTASARFPKCTGSSLCASRVTAPNIAWTTSRRNPAPESSAAIPTGADRSGSRLIF